MRADLLKSSDIEWSPDIDGQFAFSGVLSQNLLLLLILYVLFGFVTK